MAINEYVPLDIEKGTYDQETYVNLTPHFQGRVGDSMASVNLWFKRNGLPLDLTPRNVGFQGVDPSGKRFNAVGFAAYDQPGADEQVGRVNYYFPANIFQVEGQWDVTSTFFYIDDDKGQHVSTINVLLNVLPNLVEMGIKAEPFESDMDRVVAQLKSYADQKRKEIETLTANYAQLDTQMRALRTTINSYTDLINDHSVPTSSEMKEYVNGLLSATAFGGDLNTCLNPTQYLVKAGANNNPSSKDGILLVRGSGSTLTQLLIDDDANLYVRKMTNGEWNNWRQQTAWN